MFSKYRSYRKNVFLDIEGGHFEEQATTFLPTIQARAMVKEVISTTSIASVKQTMSTPMVPAKRVIPTTPVTMGSSFNTSLYTNYAIQNISLPSFVSNVSWDDLSMKYA